MYDARAMPPAIATDLLSRPYVRTVGALLLLASVAGCASHRNVPSGASASRGMYKVGAPYTIDGVTYTPMEEFAHVETGIASWYGPGFHGKSTANGEVYDQSDRTAAQRGADVIARFLRSPLQEREICRSAISNSSH